MTILDVSLCLPELDIVALAQKRSVVAVTQRFILPDRGFVLLPFRTSTIAIGSYHAQALSDLKQNIAPASSQMRATHWAQCVFCQQIDEGTISTLSRLTVWTTESFEERLQDGNLFLSVLRTYSLLSPFVVESEPVCDQLYKFVPLLNHLEASTNNPSYSSEEFLEAKRAVLEPKRPNRKIAAENENTSKTESVLDSSDWIEKISEIGHSSDGHTFEKLVRQGLLALGFSNSLNNSMASLDPKATGGAGGLDFYADKPYPIVGECKATASDSVGDPATQLHKLGLKWLQKDYHDSAKLILAAGKITAPANQIAVGHEINVISPETLQALVLLKTQYEDYFALSGLEKQLKAAPFGEAADQKVANAIQEWQRVFERQREDDDKHKSERIVAVRLVQTVKELSQQSIHRNRKGFSTVEVRSHYNAKYQPCITDEAVAAALFALTSPYSAGCLAKKSSSNSQNEYSFIKDMTLSSP